MNQALECAHELRLLAPNIYLHAFTSHQPGPTVLIEAGIHGDEISGVHALEELLEEGLRPARGRLLIIPCMNPAAYRARQRTAPGGLDLNRSFPGDVNAPEYERRLAAMFLSLIETEAPVLLATLHESWKRHHPDMPVSFGQTLTYGVTPCPPVLERVIAKLNQELEAPYERWATHYYPVATSSTEVIVDRLGEANLVGVCVETWMGFELARRVAMQKAVVRHLLAEYGM